MKSCGGCASANERCGNGQEKLHPSTAVRFGHMQHIGEFSYPPNLKYTCGAKVVIATDRGIEIGEQVSLTCHGCSNGVSRDQMKDYAARSGEDTYRFKSGRILREATATDLTELRHINEGTRGKLDIARRFAAGLDLPMKIVDCEHIFGGERIVFYFMADERIDFRELVRRLAGEFQTRIEMRQVGARDEARLLADYETCGRECCCKNFLKTLKPVSMQMAKVQKATLDPSKVSGRCGRLKCCLRYEHETYDDLMRRLPRMGAFVKTAEGAGRVTDRQILSQLVQLADDEGRVFTVAVEDILEVDNAPIRREPRPEVLSGPPDRSGPDQVETVAPAVVAGGGPAATAERMDDQEEDGEEEDTTSSSQAVSEKASTTTGEGGDEQKERSSRRHQRRRRVHRKSRGRRSGRRGSGGKAD